MKPILIILTCAFILFMLSGCVVAPYPEPVVAVRPAYDYHHHHHYHRGPYWRRGRR
jgi:hypothetical protein